MEFTDFAAAHGLIIKSLEVGRWARVPTIDHPRSRNGAYFFDRDFGFVQNWAEMQEVAIWHDKTERTPFDRAALNARMAASRLQHTQARAAAARKAAHKAAWILSQTVQEPHAYLDAHGWRDALGLVWYPTPDVNLLVIPMRTGGVLAGCQLIDRNGEKRFLTGQRTNGAEFVFGTRGIDIWAEGYATARSVSECLPGMSVRVHSCFSAGNMQRMATRGFIVADNDASLTGTKAAQATGLPWWMPEQVGTDFNDYHRSVGKFKAGMELKKALHRMKK